MNKRLNADIIIGLDHGDEGKGKVTNSLLKTGEYTHCIRFGGGHNAGHTIYNNGKKLVTHAIPSGVLQSVKSIIGPACVVSPELLLKEIRELEEAGVNVKDNLFIDKRCNVITSKHLDEDGTDTKIGTTRKGNGPAYRDKYDRKGIRFEQLPISNQFNLVDIYEEIFNSEKPVSLLLEGAQGFGLDIDWGDYPYVTSSTCTVGGAIANGIPPQSIRRVYGVAKAYQTYVGAKKFQPNGEIFNKIREVGCEYGATTGRPRQVNYIDLDQLVKAIRINGVTNLIINKTDILQKVNEWKIIKNNSTHDMGNENNFVACIKDIITNRCRSVENIIFSYSPDDI